MGRKKERERVSREKKKSLSSCLGRKGGGWDQMEVAIVMTVYFPREPLYHLAHTSSASAVCNPLSPPLFLFLSEVSQKVLHLFSLLLLPYFFPRCFHFLSLPSRKRREKATPFLLWRRRRRRERTGRKEAASSSSSLFHRAWSLQAETAFPPPPPPLSPGFGGEATSRLALSLSLPLSPLLPSSLLRTYIAALRK